MTRKWSRSPSDNYRKRYSLRPVRPWRVAFFIGEDGSRISLEEVKSPPRRSAVLCNTPRGGMRFRGHGRNGGGKPPPYGVGDGTGSLPQSPAVTAPSSEGAEGILRCVALQEDGGCAAFGAATAKACLRPTGWGMGRGLSLSHGVRRDSSLIRGSLGASEPPLGRRRRRHAFALRGGGCDGVSPPVTCGDSPLIRGGRGDPSVRCASGRRGAPPLGRRRRGQAPALRGGGRFGGGLRGGRFGGFVTLLSGMGVL